MIVIIGGSNIASNLVRMMSKVDMRVVYLTESAEEAMQVSTETGAVGVKGNPSNPEDLEDLELGKARIVVAATDREDTNILAALYAKDAGVRSVLAVARTQSTARMLSKLGIKSIDAEEQAARMVELSIFRPVVSKLVTIGECGMELYELPVKGTKLLGKAFGDIESPAFHPVAVYSGSGFSIRKEERLTQDSVLVVICPADCIDKVRKSVS
jgi:Trk K+ transport system NAD-binding subunit